MLTMKVPDRQCKYQILHLPQGQTCVVEQTSVHTLYDTLYDTSKNLIRSCRPEIIWQDHAAQSPKDTPPEGHNEHNHISLTLRIS